MLAVLAFTACSSDNDESADAPHFYNVTLTAFMGDAETRALSENGSNINASFTTGDIVEVVDAHGNSVGTLTAQSSEVSTTLSGTITGSINVNDVFTLHYLSATAKYDGQDGTLDGIAAHQHFAEGTITVSSTDPLTFTPSPVNLTPKQSVTKFSFKDNTNADISVKTFGIAAPGLVNTIEIYSVETVKKVEETVGAITGTLGTANSDVYVALRNPSDTKQTYAFTIKDAAGNWYKGTKKAKLIDGKNYTADVTLTKWIDKDATLNNQSADGAIGIVNGLPAIAVTINSTKVAVALMNVGALCPEAYGTYYTFANRASGLSNDWYVPTKDELYVKENDVVTGGLAKISNAWTTQNGVNGRLFTISEGKTFFLPAAGFIDNDNDEGQETAYTGKELVSTFGYYWSQTEATPSSMAYSLQFSSANINVFSEYKVNDLTVRPFHALTAPAQ